MSFQQFVCWMPERVRKVMDTEALQTDSHIFLATHNRITMYLQSLTDVNVKEPYNEKKFLQDFLNTPTPDFAFVPVLGGPGTGKSHLIRWLETNIPEKANRKILLIPRAGTNLKDIIESILNVMDDSRADQYRKRLTKATSSLGEEEARGHLLSNLANLIQYVGPINQENPSEAESYVAENLPALLFDWYFRDHLLRRGQIIDSLVTHIIGRKDSIEVVEERRSFTIKDLPLNMTDYSPSRVGEKARAFYNFLIGNDDIQKVAVDLMNHHLDAAIAQILQLNSEDLVRMMREVRETLAEKDVELILLIEDFAKLQGIDRQVLAAVIERPVEHGRKRQCALRTALACTPHYFDILKGTVRQRSTFSVNLDVEVGEKALINQGDVASFVSRYLNAARLPDGTLLEWYEQARGDGGQRNDSVPNQCEDCPHREPCHSGFGSVNGIGLYPFTARALERMYERVETQGYFNPRKMIRDVLRHTLENYAEYLQDGQFPPPPLLQHFGGARIGASLRRQVEAADPVNHSRREVLIDLWTDGDKLVDLDVHVHEAFGLPALGNISVLPTSQSPKPTPARTPEKPGTQSERLEGLLRQLDQWANGVRLPQEVTAELRPLVYRTVMRRIEWDAELLLRGKFVGAQGVFGQRYVNFTNSTQPSTASGVYLTVPTDDTLLNEAAVALQALLKHNYFGGWNYAGSAADFRVYAKQLEVWSNYVVGRIRTRPRKSGARWDPVPATAELLAVGTRMAGRSVGEGNSLTELVDGLFTNYDPSIASTRGPKWKQLFEFLSDNRAKLIDILRTYLPCTKGGESKIQVIDAAQLVEPLRAIGKSWHPQCDIPDDLRADFEVIKRVRERVDQLVDEAIEEERKRHLDWRKDVLEMLGSVDDRGQAIEIVRTAIEKVRSTGDFAARGGSPEELLEAIARFEQTDLNRCVAAIDRIENETDSGRLFEELSCVPQDTMSATEQFLIHSNAFLSYSIARVKTSLENLRQSGGSELESSQRKIQQSLEKLQQLTTEIGGASDR